MKNKWRNYALKDGKVQSSYLREYSCRSPKWERREASCRNRLLQSGEEQTKEEVKDLSLCLQELKNEDVEWYEKNIKGTINGNDGINGERGSAEETGREPDIQQSASIGSLLVVQDVPEKQPGRKRKKRDPKRGNEGPKN